MEPSAPTKKICHLHLHSEYSLHDGSIRIAQAVQKAKSMGHKALALTDHANLFGAIEFYDECKKAGIKAILGCEVFHSGPYQAVLLAKTNDGYHNLVKNVSKAHDRKSILPTLELDEMLCADLIFIESFYGGKFADLVMSGKSSEVLDEYVLFLKSCFSSVYVELSGCGLSDDHEKQKRIYGEAKARGLKVVGSANAHYLNPEDQDAHILLCCIKNDIKQHEVSQRLRDFHAHMWTNEDFEKYLGHYPEVFDSMVEIEALCDVRFKFGEFYLPKMADSGVEEKLIQEANQGLKERLTKRIHVLRPEDIPNYQERLNMELGVITKMGFSDYFLIVADFINWAKSQGIPVGPGRGSGAGSLVAYALRITDLDPIEHQLIFERFLNPDRISMPDFDVDFCQDRRDEVIQYVTRKYGQNQVAQIITFGKMQAKAVVRDVGRAMGLSYTRVDAVAKLIPNEIGMKLEKAIEQSEELRNLYERDDVLRELLDYSLKLEGLCRHTSVHAAGVVISDGPMCNYVPTLRDETGSLITQFEMKNAEKVGLVKFDFLGLKTLTVIQNTIRMVEKTRKQSIDIDTIPMDDARVYQLISDAISVGVFQLESNGMQNLLKKLKPSCFADIVALVALFRPGPLGSGMVDEFVERKHGRQAITYQIDVLEPILKETYGIILYQEQVQKIASVLASYTLGEADLLRRAMGKKKPEEMAKQKSRFISGCTSSGYDPKLSEEIFDLMAKFAEYGFNKSHSAAYGLISYQTAYLKTHFTAEFLACSMSADKDNTDKLVKYIEDARRLKIRVHPVCIQHSEVLFSVESDGSIRFALSAIKGLGEGVVQRLVDERQRQGSFSSLSDLATRLDLGQFGRKNLETLIQAGGLDCFSITRQDLLALCGRLVEFSQEHFAAQTSGQGGLFGYQEEFEYSLQGTSDPLGDLFKEAELLGTFLSRHPVTLFKNDVDRFANANLAELKQLAGQSSIRVVCFLKDHFIRRFDDRKIQVLRLEDPSESLVTQIPFQDIPLVNFDPGCCVVAEFAVSRAFKDMPSRIKCVRVTPLETWRNEHLKGVKLKVDAQSMDPSVSPVQPGWLRSGLQGASVASRIELQLPTARVELEGPRLYLKDADVAKLGSNIDYLLG